MAKTDAEKAHDAYVKTLSKAGKKNLGLLEKAEVALTGEETEAQLEDLVAEHGLVAKEEGEGEVIEGVENTQPQRFEEVQADGKTKKYGIYFVAPVVKGPHKGSHVLYNDKGVRVSPPMSAAKVFGRSPDDERGHDIKSKEAGEVSEFAHIAKAAGAANALRRARRLPNDKE